MSDDMAEVQRRMSKKIAQLTKVIYMLNTRNDEHEYELRGLEESYESEIQDILKSAYEKVKKFQALIEKKSNTSVDDLKATIDGLKKKNNDLKRSAEQEISEMKKSSDDVAQAAKTKVDALRKEVDAAKARFLERMQRFENVTQNGSQGLNALKEAHKKEIADLVQQSNKKYRTMLNERLDIEDKLKDSQKELEAEMKRLNDRIASLEKELEDQRMVLETEFATKEVKLKQENAEKLKQAQANVAALINTRQELEQQIQQLKSNIEKLKAENSNSSEKAGQEVSALRQKNKTLEEKLKLTNGQLSEVKSTLKKVNEENKNAKKQHEKAKAEFQEAKTEFQAKIAELTKKVETKERELKKNCEELKKALATINEMKSNSSEQVATLQKRVEALTEEKAGIRSTYDKLKTDHSALQGKQRQSETTIRQLTEKIEKLQGAAKSSSDQAQGKLSDVMKKNEALKKTIDELKKSVSKLQADMDSKLKAASAESKKLRETLQAQHEKALKEAAGAHGKKIEALEAELKRLKSVGESKEKEAADLRAKLKQMMDEGSKNSKSSEQLQHQIRQMKERLDQQLKHAQVQHKRDQEAIRDLRQSNKQKSKGFEERLSAIQAKLKAETTAHAQTSQELDKTTALLKEVQVTLDREKLMHKDYVTTTERKIFTINKDYKKAIANLERKHANEIERMKREFSDREKVLRDEFELERKALQENIDGAKQDSDEEMSRLKQQLETLILAHEKAIKSLTENHEKELADQKMSYEEKLISLKSTMEADTKTRLQAAEEIHLQSTHQHKMKHDGEREALKTNHSKVLQDERANAAERAKVAKQQAEKEKADAVETSQNNLEAEHKSKMQGLEATHKTQIDQISQQLKNEKDAIARLRKTLKATEDDSELKSEKILELKTQVHMLTDKVEEKEALVRETQREWQALSERQERELKEEHENQLVKSEEMKLIEIAALTEEFDKQKAALNAKVSHREDEYRILKKKYDSRESRGEDLEHIRALQKFASDQAALRKQAQEEMKYFKLELLNREENFNKKFGRTPSVGTLSTGGRGGKGAPRRQGVAAGGGQSVAGTPGGLGGLPPLPKSEAPPAGVRAGARATLRNSKSGTTVSGGVRRAGSRPKNRIRMNSMERKRNGSGSRGRSPSIDLYNSN